MMTSKFISEFMVESVEVLEKIVNPTDPLLSLDDLVEKWLAYLTGERDQKTLEEELKPMKEVFAERGNVRSWSPELLDKIDDCFVERYTSNGEPIAELFSLDNLNNVN